MTANFSTTDLAGDRVLVSGVDSRGTRGEAVLNIDLYRYVERQLKHTDKGAAFDKAVSEFFAPLVNAVDELTKSTAPKVDPMSYIVIREETEAVEGESEVIAYLDNDSIAYRLIIAGEFDRLIWVNERLEVLPIAETEEVELTEAELATASIVDDALSGVTPQD